MVDLDGTLIDTKEINYRAYQDAIGYYGYSIDYKYYCSFCNGRYYLDFLPKITTDNKEILSEMHMRKKNVYSKYLEYGRVNWSLVSIIKNSRAEYKTALVTTASRQNTFDILEKFDLVEVFDLILTHDDVDKSKPNPEGYIKAMSFFNAAPKECLIFEDSDVGIQAAEATGANVFIVKGYN
jgi:beta-phosphoglucomutase